MSHKAVHAPKDQDATFFSVLIWDGSSSKTSC